MAKKSMGALFKRRKTNDNPRAPIMNGVFELTREDFMKLVDMAKRNEKIEIRLSMWPSKESKSGNEYYPLSLDTYEKKSAVKPVQTDAFDPVRTEPRAQKNEPWGGELDNEIPF